MPRRLKSLSQMNSDSLRYLESHTDITFTSEGSIARAFVEATNLEIARIQEFIVASNNSTFLDTATGYYLDLIGEMFGVKRLPKTSASTSIDDRNVLFSVASGKLGEHFANPQNTAQGLIPKGTIVKTADSTITYEVAEDVVFNKNLKQVYVSVIAENSGEFYNVGRGKLSYHDGPSAVRVTNTNAISNGTDQETDKQYRFRISNNLAASPTGNETAVKLAVLGSPDVANVQLLQYSRGAGTFDVLLIPVGNKVSSRTLELTQRAIDNISAFGVNTRVVEPTYKRFRVHIQLIPNRDSGQGSIDANIIRAKNAALNYFETIPIGGELIINRLRSAVITVLDTNIKDIKILELCIDGKPHIIRNVKLKPDELFTPDLNQETEAINIV